MSALDGVLREAAATLARAGVPSPRVDAESLLACVLGMPLAHLRRAALLGEQVAGGDRAAYQELVQQRAARIPLQHLTGVAHFAGLALRVGPGVFVPRPETEVLVELAVGELDGLVGQDLAAGAAAEPVVVDLCTGSGAIALAVKSRNPRARVHAVELSEQAHAWAGRNVTATGLDVDLRLGAAQEAFEDLVGQVHMVLSNPPYIPPGAAPQDPEVREHDPDLALYGGGLDGLSVPGAVAARAAELLVYGGVLLMEHAATQGDALLRALRATGRWRLVEDHRDLAGLPRVTRAVRGEPD